MPVSDRFWKQIERTKDCWNWSGTYDNHGYGRFRYDGRKWRAHRLAWLFSIGFIPGSLHVLHKCDNPKCCNPNHLWLGTHQDNIDDREKNGRNRPPIGERHSCHVLTEVEVKNIRKLLSSGKGMTFLSIKYGVSKTTIWNIQTRKTWKHI